MFLTQLKCENYKNERITLILFLVGSSEVIEFINLWLCAWVCLFRKTKNDLTNNYSNISLLIESIVATKMFFFVIFYWKNITYLH